MKKIIQSDPDNKALAPFVKGTDARVAKLLAVLASVGADHVADGQARRFMQLAAADLFNAAARLERVGKCGATAQAEAPAYG